jgi:hypothetical protein
VRIGRFPFQNAADVRFGFLPPPEEQQRLRDELDIRTALIQAKGVKAPPSGTFGKGVKP